MYLSDDINTMNRIKVENKCQSRIITYTSVNIIQTTTAHIHSNWEKKFIIKGKNYNELETSKPKWVNPILNIIGVNLLRLGGRQLKREISPIKQDYTETD